MAAIEYDDRYLKSLEQAKVSVREAINEKTDSTIGDDVTVDEYHNYINDGCVVDYPFAYNYYLYRSITDGADVIIPFEYVHDGGTVSVKFYTEEPYLTVRFYTKNGFIITNYTLHIEEGAYQEIEMSCDNSTDRGQEECYLVLENVCGSDYFYISEVQIDGEHYDPEFIYINKNKKNAISTYTETIKRLNPDRTLIFMNINNKWS